MLYGIRSFVTSVYKLLAVQFRDLGSFSNCSVQPIPKCWQKYCPTFSHCSLLCLLRLTAVPCFYWIVNIFTAVYFVYVFLSSELFEMPRMQCCDFKKWEFLWGQWTTDWTVFIYCAINVRNCLNEMTFCVISSLAVVWTAWVLSGFSYDCAVYCSKLTIHKVSIDGLVYGYKATRNNRSTTRLRP